MLRQNWYSWRSFESGVCISRSAFSPPSWLTNPSPSTIDFGLWLFQFVADIRAVCFSIPFRGNQIYHLQDPHDPTWQSWTECPVIKRMNLGPTVLAWFSSIMCIDYWPFSSTKTNISIRSARVVAGPKIWYFKSKFLFKKTLHGALHWNPLFINHYIQVVCIHLDIVYFSTKKCLGREGAGC